MSKPGKVLNRIELLQGTLDLIVLQTLLWGPRHGYGIAQMIRANSKDVLQVETGSLYPALHRLEERGFLSADWGRSETGRRAKYYSLTKKGRTHLEAATAGWTSFSEAVRGVLDMKEAEGA